MCEKLYSRKDHLKEHLRKQHDIENAERSKKFYCPFNCSEEPFRTTDDILKHCDKEHNSDLGEKKDQLITSLCYILFALYIIIGMQNLSFKSKDEFFQWKERIEEVTYAHYSIGIRGYNPKCGGLY